MYHVFLSFLGKTKAKRMIGLVHAMLGYIQAYGDYEQDEWNKESWNE